MKPKTKRDKFSALPEEYKDAVAAMNVAEIRDRIAQVALDQLDLMNAKEEDQDLQEKQEAFKVASEGYREGMKQNKLKIEFAKRVLEDKGGA